VQPVEQNTILFYFCKIHQLGGINEKKKKLNKHKKHT